MKYNKWYYSEFQKTWEKIQFHKIKLLAIENTWRMTNLGSMKFVVQLNGQLISYWLGALPWHVMGLRPNKKGRSRQTLKVWHKTRLVSFRGLCFYIAFAFPMHPMFTAESIWFRSISAPFPNKNAAFSAKCPISVHFRPWIKDHRWLSNDTKRRWQKRKYIHNRVEKQGVSNQMSTFTKNRLSEISKALICWICR